MIEKIKNYLNKIISVMALPIGVTFIVLFVFLVVFQTYIVFNISHINPEILNASIAMVLVFVTILYVSATWQIVDESKKSRKVTHQIVEETRKDRKKANIEKRLEKLYLPLEDIIKHWSNFEIDNLLIYKYLATKKLEEVLERYMEIHNHSVEFKEEEIINVKEEISKIIEEDIERFKQNLAELVD